MRPLLHELIEQREGYLLPAVFSLRSLCCNVHMTDCVSCACYLLLSFLFFRVRFTQQQ